MSGLIIDGEACIGCGRCVRACASGGIVVEGERPNRCARVTDGCILCGGCVDACPVNAISIERDETTGAVDLDAYRDIWVFVQTDEHDAVASVAFELVGKGRELADARGCRLVALVGMGPEGSLGDLEHLVCAGADEVLVCRDERLRQNDAEVYARLICDLVAERKPEAILYGATAFGRELAPGVAVRLQTGLTADCTVLSMDTETGLLQQTRPAFGGNLMATIICPNQRPQMATVRPGIGSKKNLPLMRKLAEALGAELGCTRPVVEAGWLEYRHQIGQTGVSVSPKLLVSIGVSGAIQHLAGIGGAECIIAINEDPDAPIFGAAQYKVVGDAVEVVEELLAQLER